MLLSEPGNDVSTDVLSDTPFYKLYSIRAITLATFFCGILAGCFMMAQNFKELNENRKATFTWLITAAVFLLIVASLFIPAFNKIPSVAYSFAFIVLAGFMARKFQSAALEKHQADGGLLQTNGRIVVISIIGLLALLAAIIGIYYVALSA